MATFTTNYALRKPATGDFVTVAADISASMDIIDAEMFEHEGRLDVVETPGHAVMRKTADQSIPDASNTQITFATDVFSRPAGFANQANERFVVPKSGLYLLTVKAAFAANATGRREVSVRINGADYAIFRTNASATGVTYISSSLLIQLTLNDLITFMALQNAGAAVNLLGGTINTDQDCSFTMTYVNPGAI